MRICYSTYPTAFHKPGGGEVQLSQYEVNLKKRGINVIKFDLWNPGFSSIDLMHFFSCVEGSIAFTQYVANLGIPVINSPNLWITKDHLPDYPSSEIKRQFELSSRIVCNSNVECDLLSDTFGVARNKFVTVYNGVDRSFFEPVDNHEFTGKYKLFEPFILNVANIEQRKNQLRLVQAAKKLGIKVVIIGSIRDSDYASSCFKAGGESVIYIPHLPHDSTLLRSAYAACNLFALPSLLETPGLAALEAAAAGAKVLVTAEGSTSEYFGDFVTYVDPFSVESIADGIARALSLPPDRALRDRILNRFTWDNVIEDLVDLYLNHDLFPKQISCEHFYLTEFDSAGRFVWSRPQASLMSDKPGLLTFDWRAGQRVRVDVKVNGVMLWTGVEVGTEFSPMTLVLPAGRRGARPRVEFEVRPQEAALATGDPRELGVMVREVRFIPEEDLSDATLRRETLQSLGLLFEGLGLQGNGWFRFVEDGGGGHVWSGLQASLLSDKPGLLTFNWRAGQRARVDVKVNGVMLWTGVEVGTEFSPMTLALPAGRRGARPRVEFEVRPKEAALATEDPRELGVMVREVRFIPEEDLSDATLRRETLQSLGLPFEGLGLQGKGWYRSVKDGAGLHVWSRPQASLLSDKPGLLTFDWRAGQRARVDVKVNGVTLWTGVEVGTEFSPMTLALPAGRRGARPRVVFEVRSLKGIRVDVACARYGIPALGTHAQQILSQLTKLTGNEIDQALGIQIRNPSFLATDIPGCTDDRFDDLLGKGFFFESAGLSAWGFYHPSLDASGWHVWSRYEAALLLPADRNCRLDFEWRALQRAEVDVSIDGVVYLSKAEIGPEWRSVDWVIEKDSRRKRRKLDIVVRPLETVDLKGDTRKLGVAFRALSFNPVD